MGHATADSVVTLEEFALHMRTHSGKEGFTERAVAALDSASQAIRDATGRTLKSVTHREAQAVSNLAFIMSDGPGSTIAGYAGSLASVHVGDPVTAATMDFEARVQSIGDTLGSCVIVPGWDAGSQPTAPEGDTYLFGTRGLLASGDGSNVVFVDEFPVTHLFAAWYRDGAEWVALDTTDARLSRVSGRIELPNDRFPEGHSNILVECRAGYIEPSIDDIGHGPEWRALVRLWLRTAEVFYLDDSALRGRRSTMNTERGQSVTLTESMLPTDVLQMVQPFVRIA